MKSLYHQIKDDLLRAENKTEASKRERFHKYDHHHSLGIKAPIRDSILKKYKKQIRELSCKDTLSLADLLYQDRIEETILAGIFVLQINSQQLSIPHLPFLDRSLEYFCSWSTTDKFCIDVMQPLLLQHPKEILLLLKKWNSSKNIWKRRASVVTFVRKIGESGKFTVAALGLCNHLLWDQENLVQKGVGWCLKDLMRGDRVKLLNYIQELRASGVCSTIILYAIRDLKDKERSKILKITKATGRLA